MAEEKKTNYQAIPNSAWFSIRDKFKLKVPSEVNVSYLATALGITEASAGGNILPALKAFGILNDNNKPTDFAYEWRDDDKYQEACIKILESEYPQEIRDLFHEKSSALNDVKSWFARNAKIGESAAVKYARTYLLLLKGEIQNGKTSNPTAAKATKITKTINTPSSPPQKAKDTSETSINGSTKEIKGERFSPKLHLDIQIHISPESSAEQIDKIFESMSKHLRGL